MNRSGTQSWQPSWRTPVCRHGLLWLVLASGIGIGDSASASCVADASPSSDCEELSLAQQYINASIGSNVTVTSSNTNVPAVKVTASDYSLTNAGTLQSNSTGGQGLRIGTAAGATTVGTVVNSGTIRGYTTSAGVLVQPNSTVTSFENSGLIAGGSSNSGIKNVGGTITTLTNTSTGTISGSSAAGIYNGASNNTPGTITTIVNNGTISGTTFGINNSDALSTIGTITNNGSISGTTSGIGIGNSGTLTTLNNAQGSSGALGYAGTLPTNYNIIIRSTSSYGKLAYLDASTTSSMNFGIYTGSSLKAGTYSSVLTGLSASNISGLSGTYQNYSWYLNNRTASIWDLVVGASTEDTQTSLATSAYALSSVLAIKGAAVINGLQYDCAIAPAHNACVSVSGRHAQAIGRNANDYGGAFVIAVRVGDSFRLGLNSDQSFGGRFGDGSLKLTGNNTLVGAFIDWKPDRNGGGFAAKLSAGYENTPMSITRGVTGYSEPGSGSTNLTTRGLQLTARYVADVGGWLKLTPYAGMRQLRQTVDA